MKKLLGTIAVMATLFTATNAALAKTTVHVILADTGGNIDFSRHLHLASTDHGKMEMAPVSLKADKTKVPAGKVTFTVTNKSKEIQHEMIISKLAGKDSDLPMTADGIKVDEDRAAALGEVPELEPGKTGSVTFDLKPGFYLLYCNIEGHYESGMWAKFEVK
jgi:uncharacterized cupredoxin-like copper-binding protein